MKRTSLPLLLALLIITAGCAEHKMAPPPPPPAPESLLESPAPEQSLFKGDQAVLTDQDIARILATQIKLGDRHHLAMLNLSSSYSWSEDLAEVEARNFEAMVRVLKSSPQLTDVRLLPTLLVPEKRTVPYLREAAARIQADLLFVYTSRIESFRRDRMFKSDEVHAQCVAESVLLDVRTGIVVHTGRAVEHINLRKTPADLNFSETVSRAQAEARGKAVMALSTSLTAFLDQASKSGL